MALWTHFVAVQLKPDLLDRIPTSNTINSGSTELETTATGNNDDDETIKMAASDDAEITADEENSTDMVSSSKDEDDTTTDGELKMEQNSISGTHADDAFDEQIDEFLCNLFDMFFAFCFVGIMQPSQMIVLC